MYGRLPVFGACRSLQLAFTFLARFWLETLHCLRWFFVAARTWVTRWFHNPADHRCPSDVGILTEDFISQVIWDAVTCEGGHPCWGSRFSDLPVFHGSVASVVFTFSDVFRFQMTIRARTRRRTMRESRGIPGTTTKTLPRLSWPPSTWSSGWVASSEAPAGVVGSAEGSHVCPDEARATHAGHLPPGGLLVRSVARSGPSRVVSNASHARKTRSWLSQSSLTPDILRRGGGRRPLA